MNSNKPYTIAKCITGFGRFITENIRGMYGLPDDDDDECRGFLDRIQHKTPTRTLFGEGEGVKFGYRIEAIKEKHCFPYIRHVSHYGRVISNQFYKNMYGFNPSKNRDFTLAIENDENPYIERLMVKR